MNFTRNLVPVLLGGDLNAYSVALSFKQRFNVNSHVFTRYRCGATENSRFITTHLCSGICDSNVALPELLLFASKHSGSRLLLIPCSDTYLEMLYEIRDAIEGLYLILIPSEEDYYTLTDKAQFYSLLRKYKIPSPKSYAISKNEIGKIEKLDISYPAVLKPSRSAEYNSCVFKGKKKVYFVNSKEEAAAIAERIYSSEYRGRLILQQKLSDRAQSFVLTTLSNSEGRVVRASLGKILMLERSDTGYGNYSAIMTTPLDCISLSLINMLNKISYRGIANFDIMRDGEGAYCLELNARQGRSCDYLRASGISLAEYFVKALILEENLSPDFSFEDALWHYPSISTLLQNLDDEGEYSRVLSLVRSGKAASPFKNQYDGIVKKIYSIIHDIRVSRRLNKQRRTQNETF